MAEFTQHYENLGSVVSQALGGSDSGDNAPKKSNVKPPENWEQAQLAAAAVFN